VRTVMDPGRKMRRRATGCREAGRPAWEKISYVKIRYQRFEAASSKEHKRGRGRHVKPFLGKRNEKRVHP